ncbi:uncharacterized protein LOC126671554 isoform X2 [Mercurialis annua]|uniref:uncharacterized protein LOC126671554 isoform X2 n=1 Tax=Mercurialis annua TaxID=3986 RepID=UPI00216021DC|nr:uncharacterized protein LOC126671554 isoform X2 [Mercurialis annua]
MSHFPQKIVYRRQRSQIMPFPSPSSSPLTDDFLFKLKNLASRHEKMKIAYHELKSQINTGLLEAEDVFASLAIPLMKLVGLKTMEMAEEGRISTIITDNSLNHGNRKDGLEPETPATGKRDHHINAPEGESYVTKAAVAGKELMVKQQTNLLQLVHLLRQIETQVNSRQDDILATLGNHRAVLHKFFQKAVHYISTLHGQNNDFFMTTLKLLQVIFNNVNTVLVSVEGGVEDLVHELAEKMCNPMMKYVKGLKDDMANGTCMRLVAIVEEMDKMMVDEKRELEDARKKVRVAEEAKIEAMYKLKAIEDRVRKMKEQLSLPDTQRGLMENYTPHKHERIYGKTEHLDRDTETPNF